MSSNTNVVQPTHHVVLDGMYDHEVTKCWVRLLRQGAVFCIEAHADELQNTLLHQQWQAIVGATHTRNMISSGRSEKWSELYNLLIEASLPVLQRLTPEITHVWTLEKCFHATTYGLRLVSDPISQAVQASITNGPDDGTLYGLQTTKVDDIHAFAAGIRQHSTDVIEVIQTDEGLSMLPRKVRTPDGVIHCLVACVQDSIRLDTNHTSNNSWDVICAYMQLQRDSSKIYGIPSVSGILIDDGAIAGVLLRDIQAAKSLSEYLSAITTVAQLEKVRQNVSAWHAKTSSIVAYLHGQGYCLNEEFWGSGINEWTLMIDEHEDLWLPLSCISQLGGTENDSGKFVSKDKEALMQVYDVFIPEELEKLQAHTGG